jgi:hypothetical protein
MTLHKKNTVMKRKKKIKREWKKELKRKWKTSWRRGSNHYSWSKKMKLNKKIQAITEKKWAKVMKQMCKKMMMKMIKKVRTKNNIIRKIKKTKKI